MDITVPGDSNMLHKETERYEKYQDLAREIKKIWKSRTEVVPVAILEIRIVDDSGFMSTIGEIISMTKYFVTTD